MAFLFAKGDDHAVSIRNTNSQGQLGIERRWLSEYVSLNLFVESFFKDSQFVRIK